MHNKRRINCRKEGGHGAAGTLCLASEGKLPLTVSIPGDKRRRSARGVITMVRGVVRSVTGTGVEASKLFLGTSTKFSYTTLHSILGDCKVISGVYVGGEGKAAGSDVILSRLLCERQCSVRQAGT